MRYAYRKILGVEPFPAQEEKSPEPLPNLYLSLVGWLQNIIQRIRALVLKNRPASRRKGR
jgi:hypothetical protein